MPLESSAVGARWVFIVLCVICAGIAWLVLSIPSSESGFMGCCLLVIGVLQVACHRVFARQAFGQSQASAVFVAAVWKRLGSRGTQLVYMGVGVILIIAGTFSLIRSYAASPSPSHFG